ncbi:hypothetical protein IAT40_002897 [Kwoniella sp. CBS 6097]
MSPKSPIPASHYTVRNSTSQYQQQQQRQQARPEALDRISTSSESYSTYSASSTSTAFSPTHSRQTSRSTKLFAFAQSPTMSTSTSASASVSSSDTEHDVDLDLEKAIFKPASSSTFVSQPYLSEAEVGYSHAGPSRRTLPHIGLRRRRLLGQTIVGLAVVSMLGWWLVGDQLTEVGDVLGYSRVPSWRDELTAGDLDLDMNPLSDVDDAFGQKRPGSSHSDDYDPSDDLVVDDETSEDLNSNKLSHAEKMAQLASIQPQQWGLSLTSSSFLAGLRPWPANPPVEEGSSPLSGLGLKADSVYNLGPIALGDYIQQMKEFAEVAFPGVLAQQLVKGIEHHLETPTVGKLKVGVSEPSDKTVGEDGSLDDTKKAGAQERQWDVRKTVWQTDKDSRHADSAEVQSWKDGKARDEGWYWDLLTDYDADVWVKKRLTGSRIKDVWDNLPSGILRSDTLRYLLLLIEGGIYTDTDTQLLKSPSVWGTEPKLYKDGIGWLTDEQKKRIEDGHKVDDVLGKASVVVGVEADVGEREDWNDWWPRPIQIVQWTLASAPAHPIALNAVLRITHATATAIDWAHANAKSVKILKDQGRYDDAKRLAEVSVLNEPNHGGPLGVMDWTGPGVWTDAVLSYLRVKHGVLWTDLKNLREPLRVGDVVILPVTGFSPGVGNFGAQQPSHSQAMVEHLFAGSWKDE